MQHLVPKCLGVLAQITKQKHDHNQFCGKPSLSPKLGIHQDSIDNGSAWADGDVFDPGGKEHASD